MKSTLPFCLTIVLIAFLSFPVYGQNTDKAEPPREKTSLVAMEGTVTTLDKETREITLKGADGELMTIVASDEVKRFDEIEIGDVITFEFYSYMKAEFRKPTAEEIAAPLALAVEEDKMPESMGPGAIMGAVVKAIVTIEILNRPKMLATVRGPKGNYLTIQMEDEALMQRLNIGQMVILTYAEAIAVSLKK